jgi:hypothetical protein
VYGQGIDPETGEGDDDFQPVEHLTTDSTWLAYLVAER